jgi:hypothetical protein
MFKYLLDQNIDIHTYWYFNIPTNAIWLDQNFMQRKVYWSVGTDEDSLLCVYIWVLLAYGYIYIQTPCTFLDVY